MVRKISVLALIATALIWLACSDNNKSTGVTAGSIEGRVTAAGVGIPGVAIEVSAYLSTEGSGKTDGAMSTESSASNGDYHVDLFPGQYRIQYDVFYNGEELRTQRFPITVESGKTVTINVDLKDPAPSNLVLNEYQATVLLQWQGGYGSSSHNVYRSLVSEDNYQLVASVSSGYELESHYDVPPSVNTYKYKVTAINHNGESQPSNEAQIDFLGILAAPTDLRVIDRISYVSLVWSEDDSPIQYKIYRSSTQGSWNLIGTSINAEYNDVPQTYGIYSYRVTSISNYSTESSPSAVIAVNYDGRLDAPPSLTMVDRGSSLYMTWEGTDEASQYYIYRSLASDNLFQKVDSTAVAYIEERPQAFGLQYYKVSAIGPNGLESDLSSEVSANYDGRLDPPGGLSAQDLGMQLVVTWDYVNWSGAYLLYRSDDGGSTYQQIARITPFTTFCHDTPPAAGDYHYKVATETYDGVVGLLSSPIIVHFTNNLFAPSSVQAENTGMSVIVTWSYVSGAAGYSVYRASQPSGDYMEIEDDATGTSITDIPETAGGYYYRAQSFDNQGHRSSMSPYAYVYFSNRPLPPNNLTLYDYSYYVNVGWAYGSVSDSFLVYRAYTAIGNYEPLFWTTTTHGNDWPSTAGHYYYKVQAIYHGHFSDMSDYAHVYFSGILNAPNGLDGEDAGNYVYLTWNYVSGASSYDLYRGTSVDSMELIQTLYNYQASDTPPGAGTYYYAVLAKTRGGLPSPLCPPITVVFNP